jgi:uncharacterized RDD family membrane protein YckC
MSSTPPEGPAGYQPGEYVPFKDRDPNAPPPAWIDPAAQVQQGGMPMTHQDHYRAIYGYDGPDRVVYASWGRRVLGYLVDSFLGAVASIGVFLGYYQLLGQVDYETDAFGNRTISDTTDISSATIGVIVIGALISLIFNIWNVIVRQGTTGYSLGKTLVGIRLVKVSTGRPMGAGLCFVRQLAHYVDSLICYLGWLWPLWDARRQTIADKIMDTVVIVQPQDQAQP